MKEFELFGLKFKTVIDAYRDKYAPCYYNESGFKIRGVAID
jgi:hypothetical protein